MRVLISAFAISPVGGSEVGVGWQIASRVAKHHDLTVLCGDLNGDNLEFRTMQEWLQTHPESPKMRFVYISGSWKMRLLERLHSNPGVHFLYYAAYHAWQKKALSVAQELHQEKPFDLVHQLTYASYREPGYLWKLKVPFFWGPVSGRSNIPSVYLPLFSARERLEVRIRNILNGLTPILSRRVGAAARRAQHIWCVTSKEREFFERYTQNLSLLLENACPAMVDPKRRVRGPGDPLRVVWTGLHIPRKALPLLIRAIASLPLESNIRVEILGAAREGQPATAEAKHLAEKLGISERLTWHGALPYAEAIQVMQMSHVLVHTSLAEATSTVVMEALGSGIPVICHDICGMATAVNEECGIKVQALGPEQSVAGFAAAIMRFLTEPELLERLSQGAIDRAKELSWEAKMQEICAAYENQSPSA